MSISLEITPISGPDLACRLRRLLPGGYEAIPAGDEGGDRCGKGHQPRRSRGGTNHRPAMLPPAHHSPALAGSLTATVGAYASKRQDARHRGLVAPRVAGAVLDHAVAGAKTNFRSSV